MRAVRTDTMTGALIIEDPVDPTGTREVYTGDVVHVRLEPDAAGTGV